MAPTAGRSIRPKAGWVKATEKLNKIGSVLRRAKVELRGVDRETVSLATNKEFLAMLRKSRRSLRTKGGV